MCVRVYVSVFADSSFGFFGKRATRSWLSELPTTVEMQILKCGHYTTYTGVGAGRPLV